MKSARDMFWCEPCKIYEVDVEQNKLCGTDLYSILDNLNDEVEVIEDEKIEKIDCKDFEFMKKPDKVRFLAKKINEIIDKINEMEEK